MAAGSFERKSFTGGAQATAITAPISGTPSSFTVTDGSTFPNGASGPFVVVLGRNTADEEKILVSSRVTNQFNIQTRGYDNTSAVDHDLGEIVEHVLDASTIDQANSYVNLQSAKGDLVVHDGTNAVVKSVGANGYVLSANSAETDGLEWIDTSLQAGDVGTTELANNAVTTDKINADAVNGDKIADNSIDSDHYVNGSIDRVHLAADIVNGDKIADNSIDSEHYVNGSIDTVHLAANAVTNAKIDNDAVDTEQIADYSLGRRTMFPVATYSYSGGTVTYAEYTEYPTLTETSDPDGIALVDTDSNGKPRLRLGTNALYGIHVTRSTITGSNQSAVNASSAYIMNGGNVTLMGSNTIANFHLAGVFTLVASGDNPAGVQFRVENGDYVGGNSINYTGGTITLYQLLGDWA